VAASVPVSDKVEAARRSGLSVPRDLSVVGFDDSTYASAPSPQLTTVRQFAQMGEVAYQLLTDQMEGRNPASVRVELAATLVIRDSTAQPRAASN
jgi:DNA-binding LacI/PurR family transcriptional regulator